jgi:molybdopterin synthase sulfur carrier subunit
VSAIEPAERAVGVAGVRPSGPAEITVRVPAQLRSLTGGAREVNVPAGTVDDVIGSLETLHPGMRERLLDEFGGLRRFVNVFVADEDVRFLDGLETVVAAGQTVSIVPAVAGG